VTTTAHPSDERLDAWMDDRLEPAERRDLDLHFEGCEACRRLRDGLLASRAALRAATPSPPVPAGLEERIRAALDREDALRSEEAAPVPASVSASVSAPLPAPRPIRRRWRVLLPLAAAATALVAAVWLGRGPEQLPDPVGDLVASYQELAGAELPESLRADDARAVEARWRRGGIRFPARVFDLGGMGIFVAGGDATRLAGAPAALSLYRSDDSTFACWMFESPPAELPAPEERRHHDGIEFLVYRRGDLTLVLWQEGEVFCAFVGQGDPENVISLAVAKAMLAAVPVEEA
jgi:anti-sigma factor RsiW